MTNKEARERLNELLLCTDLLSDNDHESMCLGVEALELVDKMKTAYESDYQIQDLIEVCVEYWG